MDVHLVSVLVQCTEEEGHSLEANVQRATVSKALDKHGPLQVWPHDC